MSLGVCVFARVNVFARFCVFVYVFVRAHMHVYRCILVFVFMLDFVFFSVFFSRVKDAMRLFVCVFMYLRSNFCLRASLKVAVAHGVTATNSS